MKQVTITQTISSCDRCPYFTSGGWYSPGIIICGHPNVSFFAVLSWDKVHNSIADFCPLISNKND